MTDPRMNDFVGLSQALTGISASVLAPQLDPVDLKTSYLQMLDQQIGQPASDALLQLYSTLRGQGKTDPQIAQAILDGQPPSSPAQAAQARAIMKMWLLGSWYAADGTPTVVSANAYTGSFAWTIAQAHPMGYSELAFGYWSSPPSALPPGIPVLSQGGNS